MTKLKYGILAAVVILVLAIAAFMRPPGGTQAAGQATSGAPTAAAAPSVNINYTTTSAVTTSYVLYMATTTSVKDTGLLDVLIPDFERWAAERGVKVEVRYTAVGTGQALAMAARGDVDVVLVHSPDLEAQYIRNGTLKCRDVVAYNFFIVVGPRDDPAGARGLNATEAFRRIAQAGSQGRARFVSRADRSGTHLKELALWRAAGLSPDPQRDRWYIAVGAGMGQTLLVAEQERAYTLSDTGTWLRYRDRLPDLDVIVQAAPDLINVYSLEIVKPSRAAQLMAQYMSTRGQQVMANYTVGGVPLFTPISRADQQALRWMAGALFGPSCLR